MVKFVDEMSNLVPFFVLLVVQLHLLRNLSLLFYLPVYALAFGLSIVYVLKRWALISNLERQLIFFILVLFFSPLIGVVNGLIQGVYTDANLSVGFMRVIFCLPIYFVIISLPSDSRTIERIFIFSGVLIVISALTYPYQFMFGAISWFAESFFREGTPRFASLLGSLTAYGIVCGYGVLMVAFLKKSKLVKIMLISLIFMGAILSLQKAAIANFVIILFFLHYIKSGKYMYILSSMFLIFIIGFMILLNNVSIDDSFVQDAMARVTVLPERAIDFFGLKSLLLGVGFIGASGGLGYPNVPMAHNGYVASLLVGGVPFSLLFLFLCAALISMTFFKENKDRRSNIAGRIGIIIILFLLVNMTFSGVFIFNPSTALFFAIGIKMICIFLNGKKRSISFEV